MVNRTERCVMGLAVLFMLARCSGAPNPVISGKSPENVAQDVTGPVDANLSLAAIEALVTAPTDMADQERSQTGDGSSLRSRIREARDNTARTLRRAYSAIQETDNAAATRKFEEALAHWKRAGQALDRYSGSRDEEEKARLLEAFFTAVQAAQQKAIEAVRLAIGK
jgi:hypothetical protein